METKGVGAWVAMFVGVVWGGVFNEESINKFLTSIHRGKSCEISSGSSSSNCARNSEPGIGRASRIRVHKRRIFDFGTNVYGGGLSDLAKGWLGKKCCVGRKGLRVLWRRGLRNGNCRSRRTFSPPNVSPPFGEQTVFKGRRQRACASLFPLVRILHAHTPHVRCSLKCPRSHSGNPSCRIPANRRPISSPPPPKNKKQNKPQLHNIVLTLCLYLALHALLLIKINPLGLPLTLPPTPLQFSLPASSEASWLPRFPRPLLHLLPRRPRRCRRPRCRPRPLPLLR